MLSLPSKPLPTVPGATLRPHSHPPLPRPSRLPEVVGGRSPRRYLMRLRWLFTGTTGR